MMRATVFGIGKRAGVGSRLPRHVASPASVRLLSTINVQTSQLLRPHGLRQGVSGVRNLSLWSSNPPAAPSIPSAIPSPEAIPVEQTAAAVSETSNAALANVDLVPETSTTLADTLLAVPVDVATVIPPMQYGDLAAAGLTGWSPSGLCASALEIIHVSTGLPWFWTIAAGAVLIRIILLPFTIKNLKNAAVLAEHQDEMKAISQRVKAAYLSNNQFEIQKASLAQRALFSRIGINPANQMATALAQIPVTIGMFFAVKNICEYPIEQLKVGGISFITDLTAPDPMMILPVLSAIAMNIQLSLSARDMTTTDSAPHVINFMRALSLVGIWMFYRWPAGTQWGIVCGAAALVAQTLIFRIPAVRRLFGLPLNPKNVGVKTISPMASLRAAQGKIQKQIKEGQRRQATESRTSRNIRTIRRR